MRLKMVEKAEKISTAYYRENWRSVKGTWPTQGFQQDNTFVRCPLTVSSSLPQKKTQFFYQNWCRGKRVFEQSKGNDGFHFWYASECNLGDYYIGKGDGKTQWEEAWWFWCSYMQKQMEQEWHERWKGILQSLDFLQRVAHCWCFPQGSVAGINPTIPIHDDNTGLISLGCWTSLTESDSEVDLVFIFNGRETLIYVTRLWAVLFLWDIYHMRQDLWTKSTWHKRHICIILCLSNQRLNTSQHISYQTYRARRRWLVIRVCWVRQWIERWY